MISTSVSSIAIETGMRLTNVPLCSMRKSLSHRKARCTCLRPTVAFSGGPSQPAAPARAPHRGEMNARIHRTMPLTQARPPVNLRRLRTGIAFSSAMLFNRSRSFLR